MNKNIDLYLDAGNSSMHSRGPGFYLPVLEAPIYHSHHYHTAFLSCNPFTPAFLLDSKPHMTAWSVFQSLTSDSGLYSPLSHPLWEQANKPVHLSFYRVSIKTLNVRLSLAQKVTLNKKPPAINEQFVIQEVFSLIIWCLQLHPLRRCANLLSERTCFVAAFHIFVE